MRVLYIGHYMPGCTTRMRGEYLQELLRPADFFVVNTDVPIYNTSRIFRSYGWRYYRGPLISNVNKYITGQLKNKDKFDIVWIDKGVFIDPFILKRLKEQGAILIHFTPDTAFESNHSKLFVDALTLYDYCVTTKSFELNNYRMAGARNTLYCTQGYDPKLHKSYHEFSEKKGVIFIGQNESWREEAIARLIEKKMTVSISGVGWNKFIRKYKGNNDLHWLGTGLFHESYARAVSGSLIGLGLLSKKFPEKHTTRTFEIPACGTALAAEDNDETRQFYSGDEVLFFKDLNELTEKTAYYLHHPLLLQTLTTKGHNKVLQGKFDYPAILKDLLDKMGIVV